MKITEGYQYLVFNEKLKYEINIVSLSKLWNSKLTIYHDFDVHEHQHYNIFVR